MLKTPLDQYTPALEVVVDLTDEGRPRLSLELHPGELVAPVRDFVEPEPSPGEALPDSYTDEARRILTLEQQNAELRTNRDALAERVSYLEDRLVDARCSHTVDRELLPDEARAIAAALWHYAGEADAFGRRP